MDRASHLSRSHSDVVAVPLEEDQLRNLLDTLAAEDMAAASPAGPHIVYVTDKLRPGEIRVKDLEDGSDRPLIWKGDVRVGDEPAQRMMTPVFSRDGRRIAFAAISPAGAALFTMPASGGVPTRVTAQTTPLSEVILSSNSCTRGDQLVRRRGRLVRRGLR